MKAKKNVKKFKWLGAKVQLYSIHGDDNSQLTFIEGTNMIYIFHIYEADVKKSNLSNLCCVFLYFLPVDTIKYALLCFAINWWYISFDTIIFDLLFFEIYCKQFKLCLWFSYFFVLIFMIDFLMVVLFIVIFHLGDFFIFSGKFLW